MAKKKKKEVESEEESDIEKQEDDEEDKCNKQTEEEDTEKQVDEEETEKQSDEEETEKSEDEEDVEKQESEDLSDLDEDEQKMYRKLRSKVKKKKMVKQEGSGESPEEDAEAANEEGGTTDPGASTPSQPQHVLVPESDVDGQRTQETPPGKPMSKAVKTELAKSPLFLSLSGQLDSMKKALDAKLDSVAKSYNDRLDNMKKNLEETEKNLKKFYEKSFYKAINEEVGPEGVLAQPISKQIEEGKVRYSN